MPSGLQHSLLEQNTCWLGLYSWWQTTVMERWYSLQNREQVWKWSLDYHIGSYEWNNQGSMWNKIRMIEYKKIYMELWLIMYWHNYLCIPCSSQKHLRFITSSSLLSTSPLHQWHHFCRQVFFAPYEFFCSVVPPDATFMGSKDIGQGCNRKNWGSNPRRAHGPIQKWTFTWNDGQTNWTDDGQTVLF